MHNATTLRKQPLVRGRLHEQDTVAAEVLQVLRHLLERKIRPSAEQHSTRSCVLQSAHREPHHPGRTFAHNAAPTYVHRRSLGICIQKLRQLSVGFRAEVRTFRSVLNGLRLISLINNKESALVEILLRPLRVWRYQGGTDAVATWARHIWDSLGVHEGQHVRKLEFAIHIDIQGFLHFRLPFACDALAAHGKQREPHLVHTKWKCR
mmetsp:Transcript_13711/g.27661  ORF Transcript_13711/g.27661 Transcript_13711/m.27661 type:complete len:207 (-) Transcript_13711:40-660(-)